MVGDDMRTVTVSKDIACAIAANVRVFADYKFRATLLSNGMYRVTTNYPIELFL
jgi:hypothetical protein